VTVVWAIAPEVEATQQLVEILCDGDNAAREMLAHQLVII
jgi:hypothetical protein